MKKVTHAQAPAEEQPEEIGAAGATGGAEPQAPAVVAGDGADATGRPEHQGEPPPAAGATGDKDELDAIIPFAPAGDEIPPPGQDGAKDDAGADDDGGTDDASDIIVIDGNDPGDGSGEGGNAVTGGDRSLECAAAAGMAALYGVIGDIDQAEDFGRRYLAENVCVAAAGLIRRIGDRATSDVIGQELVLRKLRVTPEFNVMQTLAMDVFASTLRHLDHFSASLAQMVLDAEAERSRRPPPPVPIEDTTLEPIAGAFDATY